MFHLNKGTPWMLQVLPSLLPFWQERIFSGNTSFQHLHWVCFILFRQHYVQAFHSTLILAVPSLPNTLPLGFTSTLTFCSVWKSLEVSEEPFLWLEQIISCQPFPLGDHGNPTTRAQGNEIGGTGDSGGQRPPFWLQWVCWIGPSRLKAVCFLPRLACGSG